MIDACSDDDGTPEGGRGLTDKEIVSNSITFLLAGYETTANALSYTSYLLALHPSVQDRLYAEIEEYFRNNPVSNDKKVSSNIILFVSYVGGFHVRCHSRTAVPGYGATGGSPTVPTSSQVN